MRSLLNELIKSNKTFFITKKGNIIIDSLFIKPLILIVKAESGNSDLNNFKYSNKFFISVQLQCIGKQYLQLLIVSIETYSFVSKGQIIESTKTANCFLNKITCAKISTHDVLHVVPDFC